MKFKFSLKSNKRKKISKNHNNYYFNPKNFLKSLNKIIIKIILKIKIKVLKKLKKNCYWNFIFLRYFQLYQFLKMNVNFQYNISKITHNYLMKLKNIKKTTMKFFGIII